MRDIFHYDIMRQFKELTFKDVLNISDISGDEIAIKIHADTPEEETLFYYPIKKNLITYLLPSSEVENMPIHIEAIQKFSYKSKGYMLITQAKSVKIKPLKTKSFKQLITDFMPYEHLNQTLFTLWKIVIMTALDSRINVRVISFPGWLKDSPVTVLQNLTGVTATANKPSLAKMKYLLNNKLQILGLNEIQNLKSENMDDLLKFYEDTGDFKTEYENPKRGNGLSEQFDIHNLSTLTFYNFPKNDDDKNKLFDFVFPPKIISRIFPLFLAGGDHDTTACKQTFPHITEPITTEERDNLLEFLKNIQYWRENWMTELKDKPYQSSIKFKSIRWDRNWQTIMSHIALYADSESEFHELEQILYSAHLTYLEYVKIDEKLNVIEEPIKM